MALRKAVTAVICAAALALPVADALAGARAARATKKKVVTTVTVTGPVTRAAGGYGSWGNMELQLVVRKTVTTSANGAVTVSIEIPTIYDISWPISPTRTTRTIYINQQALPILQQDTFRLQANAVKDLANVSGATYTTRAWLASLQGALALAEKP